MKPLLSYLLFEVTIDKAIEEAMAISAGGASLASSGQITGGPMLPIGMKPGEKVKKRKKLLSASPAVHDKGALAIQEMPHVEYKGYEPKDFKIETMPLSKEEKRVIMNGFRDRGVLCHAPDGEWLLCTLDKVRKATKKEIEDERLPRLNVSLELEHDIQESFGAMHEPDFKGPAMPGLWRGLEDTDKPVKTNSPKLDKGISNLRLKNKKTFRDTAD